MEEIYLAEKKEKEMSEVELFSLRAPMGSLTFVPSRELKVIFENLPSSGSEVLRSVIESHFKNYLSVLDLALRTNMPIDAVATMTSLNTVLAVTFAQIVNLEKGI